MEAAARCCRGPVECGAVPALPTPSEPLCFRRIAKEKVWGGRSLAPRLGLEPDFAGPLGETWELSDYPGEETVVRGGALDGVSLRALMEAHAVALLGTSRPDPDGRFPLLVKFIEAADDLSVQVHPPDGPTSPTGVGKTEAWYVLATEPGAKVVCGLREGTDPRTFAEEAGDARVRRHLHELAVRPGDCIFVSAGQTHAIRAGVTLCEVQQTSDVTFRMYDWDRLGLDGKPRETHLQQALAVVDWQRGPGAAVRAPDNAAAAPLAECPYFRLELLRPGAGAPLARDGYARTVSVVAGEGALHSPDGAFAPRELRFGDTLLVPAALGAVSLAAAPESDLELLVATAL